MASVYKTWYRKLQKIPLHNSARSTGKYFRGESHGNISFFRGGPLPVYSLQPPPPLVLEWFGAPASAVTAVAPWASIHSLLINRDPQVSTCGAHPILPRLRMYVAHENTPREQERFFSWHFLVTYSVCIRKLRRCLRPTCTKKRSMWAAEGATTPPFLPPETTGTQSLFIYTGRITARVALCFALCAVTNHPCFSACIHTCPIYIYIFFPLPITHTHTHELSAHSR